MASSYFYQNFQSKEANITKLYLRADIGASGAPTLDTDDSKGIASIARTATGDYTITLDEAYNKHLHTSVTLIEADDTDLQIQVAATDVSSAKTIQIICTAAATPADPPDGSDLTMEITLKNTSV